MLSDARHSLRSTLHKLRQALRSCAAEDILLINNDRLQLAMQHVDCDVLRCQHLVADGSETALNEAVGLVRGPLLLGFNLDDLHYADAPTLELFGYLACHLQRLPIVLIGHRAAHR